MRRRRLLASVAGLVGTTGCAGSGDEPPVSETVTPMPVPTQADGSTPTHSGTTVAEIDAIGVQPGVVVSRGDSIAVVDNAGQYLVLGVTGDFPARSAVEFRFDGESYAPMEFSGGLYRNGDRAPTDDENGGPLVFALPATGDGTDADLVWPNGIWAPPPGVVERLEAPLPPFSVSLDGPETAALADDPQLTVSVRNSGEADGRFVLGLNRQGPRIAATPVTGIAGELEAGAREKITIDAVAPANDHPTLYTLDVPGADERLRHIISAPGSETEAET